MIQLILILVLANSYNTFAGCAQDPQQKTRLLCEGAIDSRDISAKQHRNTTTLVLYDPDFICSTPLDLHVLPHLTRVQSSSPNRCACMCRSTPIEGGNCVVSFCPAPTAPQTTTPNTPNTTSKQQPSTSATRRTVKAKRRQKTKASTTPAPENPTTTSATTTAADIDTTSRKAIPVDKTPTPANVTLEVVTTQRTTPKAIIPAPQAVTTTTTSTTSPAPTPPTTPPSTTTQAPTTSTSSRAPPKPKPTTPASTTSTTQQPTTTSTTRGTSSTTPFKPTTNPPTTPRPPKPTTKRKFKPKKPRIKPSALPPKPVTKKKKAATKQQKRPTPIPPTLSPVKPSSLSSRTEGNQSSSTNSPSTNAQTTRQTPSTSQRQTSTTARPRSSSRQKTTKKAADTTTQRSRTTRDTRKGESAQNCEVYPWTSWMKCRHKNGPCEPGRRERVRTVNRIANACGGIHEVEAAMCRPLLDCQDDISEPTTTFGRGEMTTTPSTRAKQQSSTAFTLTEYQTTVTQTQHLTTGALVIEQEGHMQRTNQPSIQEKEIVRESGTYTEQMAVSYTTVDHNQQITHPTPPPHYHPVQIVNVLHSVFKPINVFLFVILILGILVIGGKMYDYWFYRRRHDRPHYKTATPASLRRLRDISSTTAPLPSPPTVSNSPLSHGNIARGEGSPVKLVRFSPSSDTIQRGIPNENPGNGSPDSSSLQPNPARRLFANV